MSNPAHPVKKTRADSFLGMHFDFHAHPDQEHIGATADPEQIDRLLKRVKPDFLQCDTKGHFGYSSYPTEVGVRAPNQTRDILRMWREVTAQNNVALYAHHSSLWDEAAVQEHPDWAVIDEYGTISDKFVSMFSPFLYKRFIPQMIEIAVKYGLDGVWVDGDIWCMPLDYSKWTQDVYFEQYGKSLPKRGDADFPQYLALLRDGYRNFVRIYCDEIHAAAPGFQICSSALMGAIDPDCRMPGIGFVSTDTPRLREMRLYARTFAQRNMAWDIMGWAFAYTVIDVAAGTGFYYTTKELPQLCQEASMAIALGGSFQFVNFPTIDHTYAWAIPRWEQLALFCRAREPFCFQAKPIPQTAVFCSAEAVYHSVAEGDSERLFPPSTAEKCKPLLDLKPEGNSERLYPLSTAALQETGALLDVLLDNQYSVEVLLAERIATGENLSDFGLIALPDMAVIEADAKERLLAYAREGGSLLLAGPQTLALFADDLGIAVDPAAESRFIYIDCEGSAVAIASRFCTPIGNFTATGRFYMSNFMDGEACTASFELPFGKGKIAALSFGLADYAQRPTTRMRRFIGMCVQNIWPLPAVKVTGSQYIEVSFMEKDGKRCVNLINSLSGARFTSESVKVMTFDEIPPLYNIDVAIAWPSRPSAVMIEPVHSAANYSYKNGMIQLTLDKLEIHTVITVE